MTSCNLEERKRANLKRRIRAVRDEFSLPDCPRADYERLLDGLMAVKGDAPTDPDLRVLYRMVSRGFFGAGA